MEALVHNCPASEDGEGALLAWAYDWLTFDRDTDPCAILTFSGEVRVSHPRRMGSTLADVLVALYTYVVRHGGRFSGGRSVVAADKTGARAALGTAAGSLHSPGRDAEDARWVVLVDLAQFLFSCWDLLLVGVPTPLSQQVPPLHTSMAILTSQEASLQCRSAVFDCSPAVPLPSPVLLGETGDGVPEDARQCCYREGEDKEPVQRAGSHENVAQVTAESVHDVVRRVISEIFRVADDDAATIAAGHSRGPLRSPAAAATFLKMVQASPLLRRLVCSSPLLIRSLARYLLPRLVLLHHRQQQQLHHHVPGEVGGKRAVAATAIEALLSTLHAVSSYAALPMSMWSAQPLPVVASQLSCRCCSSDSEVSPASSLADSDGATLLETLCVVLQSCCGAYPSPLRLQTLRLLHLLSSSPTTRHALFSSCRRDEVSSMFSMHEEKPRPADAAAAAAAVSRSQRPSALDVAPHLLPLLLSGEGEVESVQLTCSVLQLILLHVQSPRLSAPLSDQHNNTAHNTTTAAAGVAATFTEDGIVGTADDVLGIKAAVQLAHHIKDYAMQALYSCTCKTGYALVGLLDSAASVVAGARALRQGASIGADASAEYDDATVRWEQRQDWRIIFHVAEVDMALFGVLLQGTALYDALVQCNGACVSDDGSETRLVWDEVASSIVAIASHERGAQLSLYSFLRCLDALAAGMRGNVQALWCNRLRQLAHELLERVDSHVQDTRWRPADTAAAMRTFSTLVMSGALQDNSNDESLSTTAVPHVRDAADTLLLRRMVDPQTLHLLTRVTAAYLPASCGLLVPLGVQLLDDAVCTGELIAIHCPEPSGYPTMTSASVEESRCLLRIATFLMRNQRESGATPTPTLTSKESRTRRASDGPSPTGQKPTIPPYPIPGQPHMSPYTSRGTGRSNGGADRAGLLDVLLGLYPEAPELLAARTELIHAVARGHDAEDAQPELLAARASAFVGAASLTEVAMCASDLQASLLLSLATLGCRPCVGRQELRAMLEDQCLVLCSRLQRAGFSDSTRAPVALWLAEAAEEEGDAVDPAIAETASDGDGDDNAGLLLDALQEVFILFVVRMLWYGGPESDPSQPLPSPSSQASATDAAADGFFSEAHAHALMMCVEDSVELQEGLRQLLFDLHTQYRVDVRGFLTLLQSEKDHVPRQRPHQAQAPSSVLFAAAVLSVILYDGDQPGLSATQAGAASPLRTYMRSLRSVHWLTDTSSQEAGVPFSVGLLLRSVFRVAQRELLSLDCLPHPQEQLADVALATTAAFPAAIGSLHFLYGELAFQQRGLQSGALPVQRVVERQLAAGEDVPVSASGSSPGVALSICVLREHLVPFLLRTNSSSAAHRNNLSMTVAALKYSTVLLQLMSVALWPLAPATCTSVDAVLTEYAMSRARQLLALTTAELTRADGAARKLLYPLLQLLYLLLMRAHKVDVVRRYGTDLLLFAFRARHAAIARAHLIVSGEVEQGALTDSDEDSAHVCVIASIVYIMAQQIAAPRRKRTTGDTEIGSVEDVARAASGGAAAVGGGGLEPPSRKDMPWYVWIPVLRYYWCLRTAVSRTANDHAVREQRRSVLRILVSGVEYVIRLCGVSHLACCSHSAAHVSNDPDRDERQAATILIDWCTELIFTSWRSGDDFNDAHANGTIVAARLLYLLFYRFRALAANSVWFNALVLSCMRQTALSRLLRLPLAAEGWLLAALIQVLPYVQHSRAYENYVKGSAAKFFEKPEIAVRVKLLPHTPPKEAATAVAARLVGACGGWADVSASEPELSCVLRILVAACRRYELSSHRLRSSSSSLEVIVPLGLQFVEEAPIRECPSVLEYAFPYTVPFTTTAAPPLLLVFRCFADQIHA
ncbi:conserved hypothetical protein [Leishmania infantum JPCM5]|uniref:Uncharacterized protein n=2 Tax=Leishmania infantum TaxID=5671 RepID=A4IB57_LEIIN|nr:conserved hypothetical protein [Leishmania infantum JPCM5]CAC9544018.1 hypothetical_protein_-_conserved [Leishmania infantum]CAM72071.1 conserved hypothetical protein [Leishmania infantum JPCM5]SUZ45986.1 hypothetical_protein_-_conserved [Leishmania infantum]|eukprot:XP_001468976.1 conserved hypothetical protein [Leishmania infantum JPCM5]